MAKTQATLLYDKETCSRCGGSGTYSYCQMHGSTCFKCGGRKIALTKAATKAAAAVQAFKAEHFSIKVDDLKPGDRYMQDGNRVTVESVSTTGGSRYGVKDVSGETVMVDYIEVTFTKPMATQFGPCSNHGYIQGTTVVRLVSGAEWDAVIAFARTIKKGVTVVEPDFDASGIRVDARPRIGKDGGL